ncbi:hypothetical protein [Methylobacterium haplocladii]|uniref:Uncharacterized protein n=2 Tax=Methylobacterium haplocladii TaxID=1176176 RepID=A0A512IUY7_9HYPH|nr:hypothetical protein [Methylobacterium haplocladii]GEP01511.1 hypothetical protein MHA02_38980 [Methylobacterium haplocladii]GJD82304.1 hypothetical protein HPGCJGGD_0156 [Methylobacterium haplocladii]GLS59162.1 hypothetical protein GCM10007887_18280 [Methylobacterium haplocladii]
MNASIETGLHDDVRNDGTTEPVSLTSEGGAAALDHWDELMISWLEKRTRIEFGSWAC